MSFPYFVDAVDLDIPDPDLWEPMGLATLPARRLS